MNLAIDILIFIAGLLHTAIAVYNGKLAMHLFKCYLQGENGLTLAMAALFGSSALYHSWVLAVIPFTFPEMNLYPPSMERLEINLTRCLVLAVILWASWYFDRKLSKEANSGRNR